MIKQKFYIEKYNWRVIVLYETNKYNIKYIIRLLNTICKDKNIINQAIEHFNNTTINSGFIYSNYENHISFITISETNSISQLVNTVVHEACHLQSHIGEVYGLDNTGEDICYLIGYIVETMYDFYKENIL